MINISIQEKIQNLKGKLNLAILGADDLTSNEIVELSQELDELIVLESRLRLEKYKASEENL